MAVEKRVFQLRFRASELLYIREGRQALVDRKPFSQSDLEKTLLAGAGGREKKRKGSEERNWGSQYFSTLNEMRQPWDALLLTPQGSETELNLSLG
ncbi:hypothetical protein ACS0TY_008338 [Phlomoides rotata]